MDSLDCCSLRLSNTLTRRNSISGCSNRSLWTIRFSTQNSMSGWSFSVCRHYAHHKRGSGTSPATSFSCSYEWTGSYRLPFKGYPFDSSCWWHSSFCDACALGLCEAIWNLPQARFSSTELRSTAGLLALQYWLCSNVGVPVIGDCKECISFL